MKIHNFVVDSPTEKYIKVLFCTKCGQVVWNFNWSREVNDGLQSKIKPCVEQEVFQDLTPINNK